MLANIRETGYVSDKKKQETGFHTQNKHVALIGKLWFPRKRRKIFRKKKFKREIIKQNKFSPQLQLRNHYDNTENASQIFSFLGGGHLC